MGVAAVDPDDERVTGLVDRVDREHPRLLAGGHPHGMYPHAQLVQRRLDIGQAGPASARPEDQVGGGGGHQGHEHAGG